MVHSWWISYRPLKQVSPAFKAPPSLACQIPATPVPLKVPTHPHKPVVRWSTWSCRCVISGRSPSYLRECTTFLTASCIVRDDKSDTSLWHPCLTGHRLIPLGWSQRGLNMLTLRLDLSCKCTPVHYSTLVFPLKSATLNHQENLVAEKAVL